MSGDTIFGKIIRREIQEAFPRANVKRHFLFSNKCFIVVNWPYIFIKVNEGNSKDLKIVLDQYDDVGTLLNKSGPISFYDVFNNKDLSQDEIVRCNSVNGEMEFFIPNDRSNTYLLVWQPRIEGRKDPVIAHRITIDQLHRVTAMRKSLPIALILTIVVITLGVIYTVQLYHPTVAKKRRKKRKPVPVLHDHEDYFTQE